MTDEPLAGTESAENQETVATGTADKTPVVAIGATAAIIAVVFVLALGLAALAYVLSQADAAQRFDLVTLSANDPGEAEGEASQTGKPLRYLTRLSILNIGRYMLMMMMPTMQPTPTIISGSMIEVSAWIDASTSSS